jgi:predicted SnoaL-like aldol condensation-catalyzing enzyme
VITGGTTVSIEEENKALVHTYYNLINQKDIDTCIALLSPECVEHLANGDISREQVKQFETEWFKAFPDIFIAYITDHPSPKVGRRSR